MDETTATADTLDARRTRVLMAAIAGADCNCEPGDPTCEDWNGWHHRMRTLGAGVLAYLKDQGWTLIAPVADVSAPVELVEGEQ